MQRRTFLALATLALRARANTRGMQLQLSCGALGIRADQRQAVDLAAKHGYDAIDADVRFLQGLSDVQLQDFLGYMKSKNVAFAMAGVPVDFRGEEGPFRTGMTGLPDWAARDPSGRVSSVSPPASCRGASRSPTCRTSSSTPAGCARSPKC